MYTNKLELVFCYKYPLPSAASSGIPPLHHLGRGGKPEVTYHDMTGILHDAHPGGLGRE